jgi:tetratricopeptide (TPR) repeat protein
MRYESFTVRIEPTAGGSYTVAVHSPKGEGRGSFQIPRMDNADSLDRGKRLFQALFKEKVAGLFHSSLGSLRGPHQGLRIDLALDPQHPESAPLLKLPWELLCRPETEDFLGLSRRTPVVRSLDAHRERRPAIARPRRLRILAVSASPKDGPPALDVAQERRSLEEAWKGQEKNVEIVFLERGSLEEIRQAHLAKPFHILHFMGHGDFDEASSRGVLFFERRNGTSHPFEGRRLAQLLHDFESLRLVVLNACFTAEGANPFAGVASALVMAGVPAVVAMSGPISDQAAVAFSRTFYERLATGDPVETAVTEGRLAIQRAEPEDGEWAIPTLFLRSTDGALFAPRPTVWARRAALLMGAVLALTLIGFFGAGWRQEHQTGKAMRLANDGIGFLELGRKEEARNALLSALKTDPENAATLGNLAVVEMQLGDDEAALAHAQAAVKAAPGEAVHHYNLGNLLALKKRYEEALSSLQKAVEIDPGYAYAYNEMGNVYLALDRPADARKALERGLTHDPTLAKLHKNLGRTALAERHPEEAIRHLKKALTLYPRIDPAGKTEAIFWLATAQAATGRTKEACAALQELKAFDARGLSPFTKDATLLAERQRCPL